MLGFTKDEALGGFGRVAGLDDYRAKVAARFGDRGSAFLELYPAATDEEARRQAHAADRDSTMAASMFAWAKARAKGRAPVFSYEFSRSHSYAAGAFFSDLDPAIAGAYHTSEVPFWLGTLDSFNRYRHTRDWTAEDRKFSAAMTASLVAFARTGNPNTGALVWPRFTTSGSTLLELGRTARPAAWPAARRLEFFQESIQRALTSGVGRD